MMGDWVMSQMPKADRTYFVSGRQMAGRPRESEADRMRSFHSIFGGPDVRLDHLVRRRSNAQWKEKQCVSCNDQVIYLLESQTPH